MKLLLAESGSTKTEWRLLAGGEVDQGFATHGFNPNVQGFASIQDQLLAEAAPRLATPPDKAVFYGAAFSNNDYCLQMETLLRQTLGAKQAVVEHDLLAAARCAPTPRRAIVCILGTGSNSCLTENGHILESRGGHGYLLGDEGGGVDLGKRWLHAALNGLLPPALLQNFVHFAGGEPLALRRRVYEAAKPNTLLASFAPFLAQNQTEPAVWRIVAASFGEFIDLTVGQYPDFENLRTHFVGSVAQHFQTILTAVCAEKKVRIGEIIQNPIDCLTRFHLEESLSSE